MLTALVPGFREIRSSLAAGYLCLATVWLAFRDSIPLVQPETGLWRDMWIVGGALGVPTLLVTLSFVAYLVGSTLSLDAQSGRAMKLAQRHLPSSGRGWASVLGTELANISVVAHGRGWPMPDVTRLADAVIRETHDARPLGVQLLVSNEVVFNEYDRAQAEVDLRWNLWLPALAFSLVGAFTVNVFFLLGLPFAAVVFWQAVTRQTRAYRILATALRAGVISTATLDQLRSLCYTTPDDDVPAVSGRPAVPIIGQGGDSAP
ncbi:hypothetical protein [Verrucosispora sp. WMMD1129]|uniref:hypothetical protein n=1 Tax=Verrucosispora sp. WMMD1129 TaxID=3016093 RepID=UPI002499CC77|nr:hypothetical protein [Verrucosispora sp. WMMD1129]WFE43247.1 hypothetical protein O7624_02425 [Verrucosispora sp. WMMD1129]